MKRPVYIKGLASLQAELNRLRLEATANEKELSEQCGYLRHHFPGLCWNSIKRCNKKEQEPEHEWNRITGTIINSIINWAAGKFGKK